jgi:hypothetical protein
MKMVVRVIDCHGMRRRIKSGKNDDKIGPWRRGNIANQS